MLAAYGFSAKKDLLAQLLELNLAVAAQIAAGQSVTAPGIPPGYPEPEKLVTEDCVRPAAADEPEPEPKQRKAKEEPQESQPAALGRKSRRGSKFFES